MQLSADTKAKTPEKEEDLRCRKGYVTNLRQAEPRTSGMVREGEGQKRSQGIEGSVLPRGGTFW